jgi:hypothetical protein
VHPETLGTYGRITTLALAGLVVASACSAFAGEQLAVVPGTPRPTARIAETVRKTPPPRSTPRPTVEPRGSTEVEPERPDAPDEITITLQPRPRPGPFEMNLFRKGDFMHQATKDWCVAGSAQTMMNIISEKKPNRSVAFQEQLYLKGRELSPIKRKLGPIGVDLTGWAELLNTAGYGPYVVEASDTRRGAVRKAANALRETGRPVGMVTWRGAHSWVMSGFTATADPAYSRGFQVKKVYIQDTWYPSVSTIWGASRPPNALVPLPALAEDYLPYDRPRAEYPRRDGKYMLILPVLPEGTVAR